MDNSQIALPIEGENKQPVDNFIGFYLNQQTSALLPMEYAQEIIIIPKTRVSPMPNMPKCVLGLLNRRSHILWVVNLAQLLNLPVAKPIAQQYQIIIIHVGKVRLGLVVQSVKGVTHFPQHHRQAPTELVSSLAPYASGSIAQGNEVLIILDAKEIANSPNLQPC